jgi:imidazoleglycerol-phosphate dehydratase
MKKVVYLCPLLREVLMREVAISRRTNETDIALSLHLDGHGRYEVHTGIGFLDHMLSLFAVHGLFDLEVRATGDLQVDAHHTVEDVAIVLGQALDQALGDRLGIRRMGHAYVPMDEALAFVAVDLSGRPYTAIQATWHTSQIGHLPTSLLPHFLESLAVHGRFNLHARVVYGRDDHHQAEALFKALARALDDATQLDPRRVGEVPSTKGML